MFPQVVHTPWHSSTPEWAPSRQSRHFERGSGMAAGHVWFGSMLLKKDYEGVC